MNPLQRIGGAVIAAILALTIGVSSVAAGSANVERFSLDDSFTHEEPDGTVTHFDILGDVRIVSQASGRQSAVVTMRETQTAVLDGVVLMESRSVSMQHAVTLGEDLFQLQLVSRTQWTSDGEDHATTFVFHIVNGQVIVDHQT